MLLLSSCQFERNVEAELAWVRRKGAWKDREIKEAPQPITRLGNAKDLNIGI